MTPVKISFLARWLRPLFDVRPGERLKTALMALYFFLIIALVYILKPVRNSLFLDELGAANLRFVYMGEGLFLILIVWSYVQLARRISKQVLHTGIMLFFSLCLCAFWFCFKAEVALLSAVFYIWVAAFSITMTTQFWTLANDLYHPGEAKRLFGMMISSGSLGGITGGLLAGQTGRWYQTEDLLWIAAAALAVCMVLLQIIWREVPDHTEKSDLMAAAGSEAESKPTRKLFRSSYLIYLTLLILMAKIGATVVDNQFSQAVELFVQGKEARTAFFGRFSALLNAASFSLQFFLTGLALRFLGVGQSLSILPTGLCVFSGLSLLSPSLASSMVLKVFDGSVNYSIQQAAKEVLYLPLSSETRHRIKPITDMLGFRAAKSLAGIYIVAATALFNVPAQKLEVLIFMIVPFWLWVVWKLRMGYVEQLRREVSRHDLQHLAHSDETLRELAAKLRVRRGEKAWHLFHSQPSFQARRAAAAAGIFFQHHSGISETVALELEALMFQNTTDSHSNDKKELRIYLKKEAELNRAIRNAQTICFRLTHPYQEQFSVWTQAQLEANLERIFGGLKSGWPDEVMTVLHDRIVYRKTGDPLRMKAVEFLSQALDPDVFKILQPAFEGTLETEDFLSEADTIEELVRSRDRWTELLGLWLGAELHAEKQIPSEYFNQKNSVLIPLLKS